MCIETHIFPIVVVAENAPFVGHHGERAVVVVGRVVTAGSIVFVALGHHAGTQISIQAVLVAENIVISRVYIVVISRLTQHTHRHKVFTRAIQLRNNSCLIHTGSKDIFFGIIVIEVYQSRQCPKVGSFVIQAQTNVGIVNLVAAAHRINDSHRIGNQIVSIGRIRIDSPAVVFGITSVDDAAIAQFLIRMQVGHGMIGSQNRIGFLFHTTVVQVTIDVCQVDRGENLKLGSHHNIGIQSGMITIGIGIIQNAFFARISERDIVLGHFVTTFNAQDIVRHHGR